MKNKLEKKSFVGLLIMSKIKISEEKPAELVAILQRRGKINDESENGFKFQSFPGLCQITVYGKVKPNESAVDATIRETEEETGKEMAEIVRQNSPKIVLLDKTDENNEQKTIYGLFLEQNFLQKVKLNVASAGLEIIGKEKLKNIRTVFYNKENRVKITDTENLTLLDTKKEVIEKAFEIFSKN
jgi:hypothetical protein